MKIVCFDSDGCVMDTMETKHRQCFGPCFIDEWQLEPWRGELLNRWNEINLYEMTRGTNRFKALLQILQEVNERCVIIRGLETLECWVKTSKELSNPALEAAIADFPAGDGRTCLEKALAWSRATNAAIAAMPETEKCAFPGTRAALAAAAAGAKVAVVSSANRDAVLAEWSRFGLLDFVDEVMAQDSGTKADCLRHLCAEAVPTDILMVGDAPGDRAAAEANGVLYYPILAKREEESWQDFPAYLQEFFAGHYAERQPALLAKFTANLAQK